MSDATNSESAGRWIPLESNPEVFNLESSGQKAGLVISQAHFEDIYGLDDDMLAIVPRPVKAVVLLFPIDPEGEARREEEDAKIAREGQPKIDNTIFWVKQTISNACGTIGLIHALANVGKTPILLFNELSLTMYVVRGNIHANESSPKFIIQCENKTPLERAELLATTPLFADIHAESADSGQSAQTIDTDLHFTCFVEAPDADIRDAAQGAEISESAKSDTKTSGMRLIELDGRRAGPVDHGECKDLLKDVANLVKARYMSASTSVYFNLMALSTAPQQN